MDLDAYGIIYCKITMTRKIYYKSKCKRISWIEYLWRCKSSHEIFARLYLRRIWWVTKILEHCWEIKRWCKKGSKKIGKGEKKTWNGLRLWVFRGRALRLLFWWSNLHHKKLLTLYSILTQMKLKSLLRRRNS